MIEEQAMYRIRIRGHLGHHARAWFQGLSVSLRDDGDTVLTGPVADQAALHGLLRKIRDLGMPLVELVREPAGAATEPGTRP